MVFTSDAQIDTGRYLIGGSLSIFSSKNSVPLNDSKNNSFNANIQFGKAVRENTVVGFIAGYSSWNYYYPANFVDTSKSVQYTLGVFYRRYKKLANRFYFFGEVDAVYVYSKNTSSYNQTKLKTVSNGGSIAFVPGISYAVCKNMHLELLMPNILSVSYAGIKTNSNSDNSVPPSVSKGHVFSFNSNLNSNLLSNFGIGFKFLLGK